MGMGSQRHRAMLVETHIHTYMHTHMHTYVHVYVWAQLSPQPVDDGFDQIKCISDGVDCLSKLLI